MRRIKTNRIRNLFLTITRLGLAVAIIASFLVSVTAAQVERSEMSDVSDKEEPPQKPTESPPEKEPLLLEEITVTGARIEKDLFSTPVGMNVVGQRKLLNEQPLAAAEALRDEPGIWVQKTGHSGGGPIIRGLMGKQILLLVDGLRYNNLNSFTGPNAWMNTIDVTQIERIEVIRGPGSVLYGTDALGGVINVITKRNHQFSEKLQIRPRLYTRYGSVDRSSTGRMELGGTAPRFNFLLAGDLKNVEDLRGGRDIGIQTPSSWKEGNFDLRGAVKLSEGHFLNLSYQDFHRYDVTRFDRPTSLSVDDRELFSLAYDGRGMSPLLSQLTAQVAFHNREDTSKDTQQLDSRFGDTETLEAEVQATTRLGEPQRLTYGLHFHHDDSTGSTDTKKGHSESPHATWDNLGVFVQDELSLLDRLALIPALRWDTYTLDREKDVSNPKDIGVQQDNTALTGSLGIVFSVVEYLNLTGNVGRGFRAPNNSDYRSAPALFTFGVAAPTTTSLAPETSTNFEAGIRVKHRRFQAALSGYYMTINNLLGSKKGTYLGSDWFDWDGDGIRDPDEDIFIQTNTGEIAILGAEVEAQVLINDAWSVSGNFTFIDGEDRSEDKEAPLDRAFPTNGALKLRWREPKGGRYWAEFSTRLVSRFDAGKIPEDRLKRDPAFKVNPQDRKSPLLGGDGSVPGYAIFDLRGGIQLTEWTGLTFGVENLTDRKYRDKDSRIDAPGINFVAAWTVTP